MIKPDPFDEATYYECDGNHECLEHESPEEAIVACAEECEDVRAWCREGVIVRAYRRREVAPRVVERAVDDALEHFCVRFADEYGNPEEECDAFTAAHLDEAKRELTAVVTKLYGRGDVWSMLIRLSPKGARVV